MLAAGCAAQPPPPPPPPPTIVNVTLNAAADANKTPQGVGEPVVLRLYQLASPAEFGNAEFYPLYTKDSATLGADLVKREDFELTPGQSKTATLSPADAVNAPGVFAAYRDFSHVPWRGTLEVAPHQTTNVTITAGADGVAVKSEIVPPPPPPPKPGS